MIPLYKPYMPESLPELNNILQSGALSYGKWGRKFEEKLGEFIGSTNIAVVNSFNSAMLVALTTLGVKAGDEVIASPMSCLASNQPFATIGAKVVWADIDPKVGTLSPDNVKQKITPKTKAIFHNHFCGYPGYIDEINEIGKQYGVYVVDDAIEAFGSEYKGKKIGNTGTDATVYSFQTVRLPNTIDGGAVSFKDDKLFERSNIIRDYAIRREFFRDENGEISKNCDITMAGFGATLSEINSYVGYMQMELISRLVDIQRENAKKWLEIIKVQDHPIRELQKSFQNPNFWVFGILTSNKMEVLNYFRKKGFYTSSVHLNNNSYSIFGDQKELPGVTKFYNSFLALPSGWWVDNEQII